MLGQQRGLRLQNDIYEFVLWDKNANDWLALQESVLRQSHQLPEGITILASVEGYLAAPSRNEPQILLLSSGEMSEFEIVFKGEYLRGYNVAGQYNGHVEVQAVR